jgi:hypothetical protein
MTESFLRLGSDWITFLQDGWQGSRALLKAAVLAMDPARGGVADSAEVGWAGVALVVALLAILLGQAWREHRTRRRRGFSLLRGSRPDDSRGANDE